MTDITKLIADLKELEAKASPSTWKISQCTADGFNIEDREGGHLCDLPNHSPFWDRELQRYNARLIVAMRNALPELLRYFRDEYTAEDEQEPPVLARYWLSRASEFLQEAGFEEASKALDCEYEL